MDESPNSDNLEGRGLLKRAQEYHYREELPPEEYEALLEMGAELTNPGVYDSQCFILGSYSTREKQRLEYLKQQINDWSEDDYRVYLMDDLADGLHPVAKFRIIADHSDNIIGVCEHDQGGFQLELGMLLVLSEYQDCSHLLKRSYSDSEEHEKYNWMLDAGVFDLFEYKDRMREWEDEQEFKIEAESLLTEILD